MAGIYLHIPYCKSRCTYCDFYTITDYSQKEELIAAMRHEIKLRRDYIDEEVNTIYFGGGTPSTFTPDEISGFLQIIKEKYQIADDAEITMEANPDDLSYNYLEKLRATGVNRLSIGVQSLDDDDLKRISRRHSAEEAENAVKTAIKAGFSNISIDLIFGLPEQDIAAFERHLSRALSLDVQHISIYGLTYEEKTPLWRDMKAGKVLPIDDETMNKIYLLLVERVTESGFEHYEISNFGKPGYRSRHNSSYWKDQAYLGIGPAAHSYDRVSRQWNISSVKQYIELIDSGNAYYEREVLSEDDRYNDFIMVSLRTMEGINLKKLKGNFQENYYSYCLERADKYLLNSDLTKSENFLSLTLQGVLIADSIIVDLMYV